MTLRSGSVDDSDLDDALADRPEWFTADVAAATERLWTEVGPGAAVLTAGVAALATSADGVATGAAEPRDDGSPGTPAAVVAAAGAAIPGLDVLVVAATAGDADRVVALLDSFRTDDERRAAVADVAAGFPSVQSAETAAERLEWTREAVGADSDRIALTRVVSLRALCSSRGVARRVREWCGLDATAEDATGESTRSFRRLDRALRAAITPPALEREGFVRLSPLYFADGPSYDPITYWQAGFTLPAVRAGLAYRFTDAERELIAALESGEDRAVVGPPGSGKSVLCHGVAVDWYERDRGTVLYGHQVRGDGGESLDGLRRAVEAGTGHVLVVVDGLSGAPGESLAAVVDAYDDGVSFLFEADRTALDPEEDPERVTPGGRSAAAAVLDAGVDEVEPPSLDPGTVAGVVDLFESTTGNTVRSSPETLLEQVRSGDAADRAGEPVRLAYRLVTEAGESAGEMAAAVTDAHDRVEGLADTEGDLVRRVALLANTLSAAGLPVFREYLATLSDDPAAVDAALDRLDGTVLFVGEDAVEPNHEVWAALYLREVVRSTDRATAHERFASVVNALFTVFDPAVRERIGREDGADFLSPLSPPASFVSKLVDLGVRWPVLAPLYGTVDTSEFDPPSVLSTNSEADFVADRGDMYFRRGDTDLALREYEAAWELVEDAPDLPPQLRERNRAAYEANRGKVASRRGSLADAASYYERALTRYRDLDDRRGTAGVLSLLGTLRLKQGDYGAAEDCFEECVSIYRDLGAHREAARALNDIGITAWEHGDTDAAESYLRESLSYNRRLSDRRGAADCLHKLGMVDWQRGEFDDAREKYERSLRIRETLGDRYGQAATLNGLGNVALEFGDLDEARDCFEEALAGFRAIDDEHGVAAVTTSLGNLEMDRERYDAAREHFEDAVDVFEAMGADSRLAEALNNLGITMIRLGDLDRAEAYCNRSLERKREVGDEHGTANTRENLGRIALQRGELEEARDHYERALEHFRAKESEAGVGKVLTELAKVDRAAGNDETALSTYEDGLERLFAVGAADVVDPLSETIDLCLALDRRERAIEWCRRGADELDGEAGERFERRRADLES